MQQWPGDSPQAWIDDIGHAIAERYRRIEDALKGTLERLTSQHLDVPDDLIARHSAIMELREQAKHLVKTLDPDQLAKWATEEAARGASAEISRVLMDFPAYAARGAEQATSLTAGGAYAVTAVELDLRDGLRALNERILRAPVDAYQAMTSQHIGSLLAGVTTSQALHRRILDEYLADGITGFTDKSGRRWTIGAYSEMATRTAAARAWRDQSVASMSGAGITTFTPVIGSSGCGKCAAWAGKIITDGGPVGLITVPHAITAEPTQIHVDATLVEMHGSGWGHPNCRCTLVPSLPGRSNPTKYSTHDPEKQADREKLRELERDVRQAKRDGDRDEIGAAQAALRQHVKETGIIRRPYREQLTFADGGESNPRGRTVRSMPRVPREKQTWAQRQAALNAGDAGELLQPHEIRFYEQFHDAGERFKFIPRPPNNATGQKPSSNDFLWGKHEVELKSFERPKYDRVADEIQRSVERARTNHGVTKDTFIVYSREHPPVKSFLRNISKYNQRRPDATIKRLYWWDGVKLHPLINEIKK